MEIENSACFLLRPVEIEVKAVVIENSACFLYRPVEIEDKKKDVFIKKIVDKITERDRESWNSGSSYRSSLVAGAQGMSTALDARLEFGLETQAELRLKVSYLSY